MAINFLKFFFSLKNILWTCCVFFYTGKIMQHIFSSTPYRSFVWDSKLGIFLFGEDRWNRWIQGTVIDEYLVLSIYVIAFLFLIKIFYVSVKFFSKKNVSLVFFVIPSFLILFLYALLKFKSKSYQLAMLMEYALQFSTPFILYFYLKFDLKKFLYYFIAAMTALTFVGHGFYALGVWPRPGHFTDMVISIFSVSEGIAVKFLILAGILDILLSIGVFFPKFKIAKFSWMYAAFWGFITALARPYSNLRWESSFEEFFIWGGEFLIRAPHFLVPLFVVMFLNYRNSKL